MSWSSCALGRAMIAMGNSNAHCSLKCSIHESKRQRWWITHGRIFRSVSWYSPGLSRKDHVKKDHWQISIDSSLRIFRQKFKPTASIGHLVHKQIIKIIAHNFVQLLWNSEDSFGLGLHTTHAHGHVYQRVVVWDLCLFALTGTSFRRRLTKRRRSFIFRQVLSR